MNTDPLSEDNEIVLNTLTDEELNEEGTENREESVVDYIQKPIGIRLVDAENLTPIRGE